MAVRFPRLSDIRVGEPDANAEYFAALRGRYKPVFLNSYLSIEHLPISELEKGEKFLVYGQKGTGKTAVLRFLQSRCPSSTSNEFLIFKKALMEEIDVQEFSKLPLMVDEEALKAFKHYHHAIKRILILILLKMTFTTPVTDEELSEIDSEDSRSVIKRLKGSSIADVVRLGFDSIRSLFSSVGFDIEKATSERLLIDAGRLLKRNNDDVLTFLCKRIKRRNLSLRLYIDEIHFAYRSEESLQQDAILVRDTILAIQNLNDRFAQETIDVAVCAAVRSEYLEHPIISTADINHTIESVGYHITWSTFPQNKSHPLFYLIYLRFKASIGESFSLDEFFSVYMLNIDPVLFLRRTWAKPRDFIRFFKCAKELNPTRTTLSDSEQNAVWRVYAQQAWNEIKSSASPFLSPPALTVLESELRKVTPEVLDGRSKLDVDQFSAIMRPVYEKAKGTNTNFYDFEHFMNLLYILGLFQTRRRNANQEDIWQSYHRGNRSFQRDGQVLIHPTVLKAFG